jgi:hypothetical protein
MRNSLAVRVIDYAAEMIKRRGCYRSHNMELRRRDWVPEIRHLDVNHTVSRLELRAAGERARLSVLSRRASTSGTSGRPFVFPQSFCALQREQLYIDSIWRFGGFRFGDKVAVMRGGQFGSPIIQRRTRALFAGNRWLARDLRVKYQALLSFRPKFIHCYPSVLERFLAQCGALGLTKFPVIQCVFAGSEQTTDAQIDLFNELLGASTVSWYGQSEQVVLAVREASGDYSVVPGYSNVGVIPHVHGLEIAGSDGPNEFFSGVWYRTGDYCKSATVGYSEVQQVSTVMLHGLTGRVQVVATAAEGQSIPVNQLIFGLHSARLSGIGIFCVVQLKPGVVAICYAGNRMESSRAPEGIRALASRFEPDFRVNLVHLPDLAFAGSSKWRYFLESIEEFASCTGLPWRYPA